MIRWILALGLGAFVAWLAYSRAGNVARRWQLALAALRTLAVVLVLAIVLGAPSAPPRAVAPVLAVDVSASWLRTAGDSTTAARGLRETVARLRDSLRLGPDDPVLLVGDSTREAASPELSRLMPTDAVSQVRGVVDRASALGRPLVLLTDGEVDDADVLADAPQGSVAHVPARASRVDVALSELIAPPNANATDTLTVTVVASAGSAATPAGTVRLAFDTASAGEAPVPALAPFGTARLTVRTRAPRGSRAVVLRAAVSVATDAEPRNDTIAVPVEIGDRPTAVFVSTAPDIDVREALTVLRGALSLPTRAYLRLAPGVWREEGTLAAVSEADVRSRAAAAGLVILHGDTTFVARGRSRAARLLWAPAAPAALARAGEVARTPEWYASSAPVSPLSASLSGLPWDTLPPVALAAPAAGDFVVLSARLGRTGTPAPAIAARVNGGTRTIVVSGSGYSGWSLRGGRSAEAFTALWGAVFDWLAAARSDPRLVYPYPATVSGGERVRWRRGADDTTALVTLVRRGGAVSAGGSSRADVGDTLRLSFGTGNETQSAALRVGVYDVQAAGGNSVLVVNAGREWIPRAPSLRDGPVNRSTPLVASLRISGPRVSDSAWPFVVALLLLCAEWIGRRQAGLR